MKALNQKAEQIFRALIAHANESGTAKIDNGGDGIMAVHIEKLTEYTDKGPLSGRVWSIAHYFEQNGDLCNDPDMTFLETPRGIYPLSFEMQGTVLARFEQSVHLDQERPTFNPRMQRDHANFANQWMVNIKAQQGIKIGPNKPGQMVKAQQSTQSTESSPKSPGEGLELVEYSPLSFAIFGERTKELKDTLHELGGKFNRFLKRNGQPEPGWIFSKKREQEVRQFFSF